MTGLRSCRWRAVGRQDHAGREFCSSSRPERSSDSTKVNAPGSWKRISRHALRLSHPTGWNGRHDPVSYPPSPAPTLTRHRPTGAKKRGNRSLPALGISGSRSRGIQRSSGRGRFPPGAKVRPPGRCLLSRRLHPGSTPDLHPGNPVQAAPRRTDLCPWLLPLAA